MPLDPKTKQSIIKKFSRDKSDTGSPEVQVALLTKQIKRVVDHLKIHSGDKHTRRGLVKMVSKRRRLLNFLKDKSKERFNKLTKDLKL